MRIEMYFYPAKKLPMIFLQSEAPIGGVINMAFLLSFFAIAYFFFIRPSVKKQKAQESFGNELTKGKEVVTTSGIIGRVNKIEDEVIQLQVDQKTFIRVVKGAISKELTEKLNSPSE